MDEITIDEKKYISSKKAASITGYAKDYVGQLCREGHVVARRIGRSWYVLESAIKDHRFGPQGSEEKEVKKDMTKTPDHRQASSLPPTWTPSRYEAMPVQELPSINLLKQKGPHNEVREETGQNSHKDLQEAWENWFEHYGGPDIQGHPSEKVLLHITEDTEGTNGPENTPTKENSETGSVDVTVPIAQTAQKAPSMPLEKPKQELVWAGEETVEEKAEKQVEEVPQTMPGKGYRGLRVAILLITATAVLIAAANAYF